MVAIVILIAVIIATSKIFGTASQVAGIGNATTSMFTEAAAIERQLRADIARLSSEGFFVIRCVAVTNDVNGAGGPLLNPLLPPNAVIRADQLVFFADGLEGVQTFRLGTGSNHKPQGTTSRVYYGHAFQLPQGNAFNENTDRAHDPDITVAPWYAGPPSIPMVNTRFITGSGTDNFDRTAGGTLDGTQPPAISWLLSRQNVTLVDDDTSPPNDNSKTAYLATGTQGAVTARSIFLDVTPVFGWSRELRNGRVDAAATQLEDIRRWVTFSAVNPRPWRNPAFPLPAGGDQLNVIRSAVYYPRAERRAPSMHRVDQSLTNSVISSACSSFRIEWTYAGGTGFHDPTPQLPNSGDEFAGVFISSASEQPWFGLNVPDEDGDGASDDTGVGNYGDNAFQGVAGFTPAATILPVGTFPNNIESSLVATGTVQDYWAIFGYNQHQPLNNSGVVDSTLGYTPFPTAIRITMTLHDPEGKLENGREFQFVIDLPRE